MAAYEARRRAQDTHNDNDGIARSVGAAGIAQVSKQGGGLAAALMVGIAA